ncbi:PAS domain S-box [uncultured delta proteobacterium]|uniref:HTH-type transcriptional regulatory protein TyrR n=1 Tax=uncultured delta proteobacterium TaxID=34034 RepID=A0A212JIM9_9DELT|nr:PAS domain S-box [uncultured delta proteobacterium]
MTAATDPLLMASPIIESILAAISSPILGVDRLGAVRLCNEAMAELLRSPKNAVIGKPLAEVIEGTQLMQVVETGHGEKWQKFSYRGRSFLVNRSPLLVRGEVVGALASLHEISELEQISSELMSVRLLTEELEGIIDSAFDGIYVTDSKGVTLRINKSYERITGLKREEVVGHSMYELVKNKVFDQSTSVRVLETGEPATLIQKIRNGATVMVSGNPLRDANGNIVRVVTTVRDLTELNRLRDELNAVGNLKTRYEDELRQLKRKTLRGDDIIVHSAAMEAVFDLSSRLSSVDSTVLIQGESGVGKEVVAEFIHSNSPRKDKAFVRINCAAIPEQLLESELFGYVRGAFTGANKEGKIGLFEAADGGTLLLDEIGDLPATLQVKLLRVIQDRQTRRIGDNIPRYIDVRLIAATNHNLVEMVRKKQFREDLYYRLNVVPIQVPPLRERKEDILFMVQAFLKKFCERHHRSKELDPALMPRLIDYSWPGNVRELENIMERLVVTSPGSVIGVEDLPPFLRNVESSGAAPLALTGKTLKDILDEVEATVLRDALARHKTTRRAAEVLGIDQSSVVRKARKLGLALRKEKGA